MGFNINIIQRRGKHEYRCVQGHFRWQVYFLDKVEEPFARGDLAAEHLMQWFYGKGFVENTTRFAQVPPRDLTYAQAVKQWTNVIDERENFLKDPAKHRPSLLINLDEFTAAVNQHTSADGLAGLLLVKEEVDALISARDYLAQERSLPSSNRIPSQHFPLYLFFRAIDKLTAEQMDLDPAQFPGVSQALLSLHQKHRLWAGLSYVAALEASYRMK